MDGLKDKVAIVTGAARQRGIGSAIALRLAQEGCDVVVAGRPRASNTFPRHEQEIGWRGVHSVADEVRSLGQRSLALDCDVADPEQVRAMTEATIEAFGYVDILVNNAGAPGAAGVSSILDGDQSVWRRTVDVNLNGLYFVTRAVGDAIRRGGRGGSIVNISSLAGRVGLPNYGAYCSTKWAMIGFTQQLAGELAPYNIRVNCVCPGSTDTDMMDATFERTDALYNYAPNTTRETVLSKTPLSRQGRAAEIAAPVAFLASDEASFITGQTLNVDGGRRMD